MGFKMVVCFVGVRRENSPLGASLTSVTAIGMAEAVQLSESLVFGDIRYFQLCLDFATVCLTKLTYLFELFIDGSQKVGVIIGEPLLVSICRWFWPVPPILSWWIWDLKDLNRRALLGTWFSFFSWRNKGWSTGWERGSILYCVLISTQLRESKIDDQVF